MAIPDGVAVEGGPDEPSPDASSLLRFEHGHVLDFQCFRDIRDDELQGEASEG